MEQSKDQHLNELDEHFKPYGTIAFIVILIFLAIMVWFSVYNLQLERH
ncbi:cytochrome c oxidase subunit 2A [Neptunitalea lumnitzerae]|nr:cytochrome c oxidase subunit 2A [Neptunitalea sp. Y10]